MVSGGQFLKTYIFSDRNFYRQLLTFALPIILQNLIASSLSMIDAVMVGALGDTQIAAVGIANQYVLLVTLVYSSIYSGCGIFISQFWGKKDPDNIKRVAGIGLILGITVTLLFSLIGILFSKQIIRLFSPDSAVIAEGASFLKILSTSFIFASISFGFSSYLRNIGRAALPMIVSAGALVINTSLNFILIFGRLGFPVLGVRGAALATLTARIVEMTVFLIIIYTSYEIFSVKLKTIREITGDLLVKVCKTTAPVTLNEIFWCTGFLVYAAVYGHISTEAVTAVQINGTVQNLFLVAAYGMGSAAAIIIGHNIGAGEEKKSEEYACRFIIISAFVGVILGAALAISTPGIISLFNISETVSKSATAILYINSIIIVLRIVIIVAMMGILRGGGDAKFAFISEAATMWFIGVPVSLIGAFVFKLEVQWVVLMIMSEEIVKFAVILIRISSKKWIKNIVKDIELV